LSIRTHNVSGDRHWLYIQLPYDHDHDSPLLLSSRKDNK